MWTVELQSRVQILAHLLLDGWPCMASLWLRCLHMGHVLLYYKVYKHIENLVDVLLFLSFL